MSLESLHEMIIGTRLIYVGGKGGVGKSTITTKIASSFDNFKVTNLDEVIRNDFGGRFDIYLPSGDIFMKMQFASHISSILREPCNHVIEGTIKDENLISLIFGLEEFLFILVEPRDRETYKGFITKRFCEDVRLQRKTLGYVWKYVTQSVSDNCDGVMAEFDGVIDMIVDNEMKRLAEIRDLYHCHDVVVVKNG